MTQHRFVQVRCPICSQHGGEKDNQATQPYSNNPVMASFHFWHVARTDDDTDAKTILTAPHQRTGRDHQGIPILRGWTPSSEIWEPITSHWMKHTIWLRTVLCGGWCLCMALHTPSGAYQIKRKLECGSTPNVMAAPPNIGGTFCSTLQSLADSHY